MSLARMLYANPYGRMSDAPGWDGPPDDPNGEAIDGATHDALDAISERLHLTPAERSSLHAHLDTLLSALVDRRERNAEDFGPDYSED